MPFLTHPARFSPNLDDLSDSELEDESHSSTSSSGCWKKSDNQRMSFKSYCTYQNLKPHSEEDIVYATQSSEAQSLEESKVRSWQPTRTPRMIKAAHQIPSSNGSETPQPLKETGGSFQPAPHSEVENPKSIPTSQRLQFKLSIEAQPSGQSPATTPTTSIMVFHQPTTITAMQGLPMTETTSNMGRYLRSRWLWQLPTGLEEESASLDAHLRKHICPEPGCKKRFTSPGSLRAHFVVHTGATPFQCPYPGCGKEFNVMSNMRRHFRAHSKSPH